MDTENINKLEQENQVFCVEVHYENDYKDTRVYKFPSLQVAQDFINDEIVTDIYGEVKMKSYYEIPQRIYAETEYKINNTCTNNISYSEREN